MTAMIDKNRTYICQGLAAIAMLSHIGHSQGDNSLLIVHMALLIICPNRNAEKYQNNISVD